MSQTIETPRRIATADSCPVWSIAVFARNEADSLGPCLHALARAAAGATLHVTVLVNGSTDRSREAAIGAMRAVGLRGRVYHIAFGDKANACNQFIHVLRPRADLYFFVDGYAAPASDALARLADRLAAQPDAVAAGAVPTAGRSAAVLRRSMLAHPALHGSLFALQADFVARLAARDLRLPVGLYRGDGLLGSMALHDLDVAQPWKASRIAVDGHATWAQRPGRPWRWKDMRRHWRRLVQQGRGRLESQAIRHAIYPAGFAAVPGDATRMVLDWVAADPAARQPSPWRDPFAVLALRRMRKARPLAADALRPVLIGATDAPH